MTAKTLTAGALVLGLSGCVDPPGHWRPSAPVPQVSAQTAEYRCKGAVVDSALADPAPLSLFGLAGVVVVVATGGGGSARAQTAAIVSTEDDCMLA
jgi:hypothetical protein